MKIDVALNPAEIERLPKRDLAKTTCIVFDVLRATSSIITGLAHGALEIYPVTSVDEARALREDHPRFVLGGERHGERIDGFDIGNSPFEYQALTGGKVITTTTNGTVALRACEHGDRVLVGAILNLGALVEEVRWAEPAELLLVCAGTFDDFALEDAYAAGLLVAEFPDADLTDGARAALGVAKLYPNPLDALLAARNGKVLVSKGRRAEVECCAQLSHYNVIGLMDGAVIRSLH